MTYMSTPGLVPRDCARHPTARIAACLLTGFLVLLPVPAGAVRAGDDDRADRPLTPEQVEKERQALLKRLGDGPVYLVEILYRDEEDGRLYLCQTLLSEQRPRAPNGIPGLGLDPKGKPLPVPDPQRHRLVQAAQNVASKGKPPLYPPALTTRHVGAWLEKPSPGRMCFHVSDLGYHVPLPKQAGRANVALARGVAFRVELLAAEPLKQYRPLRDDPDYFRRHVAELRQELLTTHRDLLTEHSAAAAVLLQEPFLLDLVRRHCQEWIDRPGTDLMGLPMDALRALGLAGDASDVNLLRAWQEQRPKEASWLHWPALNLARRLGPEPVLPLLADLLRDPTPAPPGDNARRLLDADPSLPAYTQGDAFLSLVLSRHKLDPGKFGLKNAPARLLAERLTVSVEDRERMELSAQFPLPSDWLFLTTADRTRGVDQILQRLRDRPKAH
jgi:hypothetical protein